MERVDAGGERAGIAARNQLAGLGAQELDGSRLAGQPASSAAWQAQR